MATTPRMVRVLSDGQVPLPDDVRQRLGIRAGNVVSVLETADGILITSREVAVHRALDRMGDALREQNLSLEDLIESGREERAKLVREEYGLDPDAGPA